MANIKFPPNSLDPSSKAWGRALEDEVRRLSTELTTSTSFSENSAAGLNGTLRQLSRQISELAETQAALVTQQATLAAQQTALAAQQSAMSVQIARIDSLVSDQVTVGIAATVTTSGWSSSTGHAAKAASSIGVPSGYSQAFVFALASMHFQDTVPNGGWVRTVINGSAGGEMGGLANLELGQSASHTAYFNGLSGGSLGIECQMRSSVGTGGMPGRIAQISGFAIFLK